MATPQIPPQVLQQVRDYAAQWGKIVVRRAFGDAGPGLDLSFTDLEQLAAAAAAGLTEGTLATLLQHQAQALGDQQPCPDCGRLCTLRQQTRSLHIDTGQAIEHDEPFAHCPDCRRDFFPPPGAPRTR